MERGFQGISVCKIEPSAPPGLDLTFDHGSGREGHGLLDDVAQLSDVPWKVIPGQDLEGGRRKAIEGLLELPTVQGQKVSRG